MDTTSHIIIGLGLAALAQLDPMVRESVPLAQAVLLGTTIGSNAPDFDIVYKLKGKSIYYRNHRGFSHSLPMLPTWALLVSGFITLFFSNISFIHLFLWTFLAVILHVVFDLFNVYGTQILKPFHSKWVAFDSVPLFDPHIIFFHIVGFIASLYYPPGFVFAIVYIAIILYISARTVYALFTKRYLYSYFVNAVHIKLVPRSTILKWDVLIETNEDFLFGTYSWKKVFIEHSLSKNVQYPNAILNSRNHQWIQDFLSSTNYAYPFVKKQSNGKGYIINWKDLRFRNKTFFPYRAILILSNDMEVQTCYTGWIYSLKQYRKILKKLKKKGEMVA